MELVRYVHLDSCGARLVADSEELGESPYAGHSALMGKLDDDVIDTARAAASKLGIPFRAVVNRALRLGLDEVLKPAARRPYRTTPHEMGLREGFSLDNVQELLSRIEGEDTRWSRT